MQLKADQPIHERVRILEEALAKCLNIDVTLRVEGGGEGDPQQYIWVLGGPFKETHRGHNLHDIARDLERLLA